MRLRPARLRRLLTLLAVASAAGPGLARAGFLADYHEIVAKKEACVWMYAEPNEIDLVFRSRLKTLTRTLLPEYQREVSLLTQPETSPKVRVSLTQAIVTQELALYRQLVQVSVLIRTPEMTREFVHDLHRFEIRSRPELDLDQVDWTKSEICKKDWLNLATEWTEIHSKLLSKFGRSDAH